MIKYKFKDFDYKNENLEEILPKIESDFGFQKDKLALDLEKNFLKNNKDIFSRIDFEFNLENSGIYNRIISDVKKFKYNEKEIESLLDLNLQNFMEDFKKMYPLVFSFSEFIDFANEHNKYRDFLITLWLAVINYFEGLISCKVDKLVFDINKILEEKKKI